MKILGRPGSSIPKVLQELVASLRRYKRTTTGNVPLAPKTIATATQGAGGGGGGEGRA